MLKSGYPSVTSKNAYPATRFQYEIVPTTPLEHHSGYWSQSVRTQALLRMVKCNYFITLIGYAHERNSMVSNAISSWLNSRN